MDHLVAIEDKAVGLFVSTQPAEAADQMFDGSGGAYQAANGDVAVNKQMYNVSHKVNGCTHFWTSRCYIGNSQIFEFFQIEFSSIYRIHRICRRLFLVIFIFKIRSTKISILQNL